MSVFRILHPEDDRSGRAVCPVRFSQTVLELGDRLYCLEFCPDTRSMAPPDDRQGKFTRAHSDDGWFRIRPI
jgi:hypothetical protein